MMSKHPTPIFVILFLILDVVLTTFFSLSSFVVWSAAIQLFAWKIAGIPVKVSLGFFVGWVRVWAMTTLKNLRSAAGVSRLCLYASYFTSVWVWLYVLASVLVRILHRVRALWVKIVPFLNVDNKPMQAIGRIAGLIAGLLYGAGLAGLWLYQHL
jgi:hypothetical protein